MHIIGEEKPGGTKNFRLFYWGLPSPSGKTYTKEVAEYIVEQINDEGLLASFSHVLNVHLIGGLVSNAELRGNIVYADIALLGDTKDEVEDRWEDGTFRCTVVLKAEEPQGNEVTMEHVKGISHVLIYS